LRSDAGAKLRQRGLAASTLGKEIVPRRVIARGLEDCSLLLHHLGNPHLKPREGSLAGRNHDAVLDQGLNLERRGDRRCGQTKIRAAVCIPGRVIDSADR